MKHGSLLRYDDNDNGTVEDYKIYFYFIHKLCEVQLLAQDFSVIARVFSSEVSLNIHFIV